MYLNDYFIKSLLICRHKNLFVRNGIKNLQIRACALYNYRHVYAVGQNKIQVKIILT